MTITEETLIDLEGKEMDMVTFKQFVEELCGVPFEKVYKDYLGEEAVYENSNLE